MLEALSRAAFDRDVGRLTDRTAAKYGWKVITAIYPVFDVLFEHASATPFRVRLTCDNWDDQPPSIELLDGSGAYLSAVPPHGGQVFNPGPHRHTGRPFVCMRGAREYHTHESHVSDYWTNYRGQEGNDLLGLVAQLWRAWKRVVK